MNTLLITPHAAKLGPITHHIWGPHVTEDPLTTLRHGKHHNIIIIIIIFVAGKICSQVNTEFPLSL